MMFRWITKRLLPDLSGIRLADGPAWKISPARDLPAFLRALPSLVPDEAVLYIEGNPPADVRRYLNDRAPTTITKVARGTIWPKPAMLHMAMTPQNLDGLAALAEANQPAPAVVTHLHVYRGDDVLLEWYDAFFDDPIHVSKLIPESDIRAFCEQLGLSYESVPGFP